jgi:UDP-GlcNAc:undecaprenyl-phosphate GlcNAc-1-phosphate transferase
MLTYSLALLVPWALALMITPLVVRWAHRRDLLVQPTARKQHDHPVPQLGGLAIFLAVGLGLLVLVPLTDPIHGGLWGRGSLIALIAPTSVIVALGVWDDLRELPARFKLVCQLAVAGATWFLGFRCGQVEMPFGWVLTDAPLFSFALTVGWIVVMINAMNLIDGLDGLLAGTGIVAALTIFVLAFHNGASVPVVVALALAGALAGYLRFNLPPARIFSGDGGAYGIGYLIAVTSLASYHKSPTAVVLLVPMLALGLPIIDTAVAIVRRFRDHVREQGFSGLRPSRVGDAVMRLRSGWSVRRTLAALYALSAALGVTAVWTREWGAEVRWGLFLGLLAAGFAFFRRTEKRVQRLEAEASSPPVAPPHVVDATGESHQRAAG